MAKIHSTSGNPFIPANPLSILPIAVLLFSFLQTGYATDTVSGGNLFYFTHEKQIGDAFQRGDVIRINPNVELLGASLVPGKELVVPSPRGGDNRFRITSVTEFVDGVISVRAAHIDSPYDQMTFSFDAANGLLLGSINHFARGDLFRIQPQTESYRKTSPGEADQHLLLYRNPDKEEYYPCGVDGEIAKSEAVRAHYQDPHSQSHVFSAFDIQNSGMQVDVPIDLMIVYTNEAETWANQNEGNIQLLIAEMINISQTALDNSDAGVELRVVHTYNTSYEQSGDAETDLFRLATSPTFNLGDEYQGYMEYVHTMRNQYGADLVSLLATESGGNVGGLAFLMNNISGFANLGFSWNRVQQMTGTTTFIHEIGHNLGNEHSRDQFRSAAGVLGGLFDYSTGWRFTGDSGASYSTVMAYREAANRSVSTRIPYFSNPEILFDGQSTGSYIGESAPADNVRSMRYTRNIVSNYRPTQINPPLASLDDSPIQIEASYLEAEQIGLTLSNDGDSPLYWTVDVRYPDPAPAAKVVLSSRTGLALEGPDRPVPGSTYPHFDTRGEKLIRYPDRADYGFEPVPWNRSDLNLSGNSSRNAAFSTSSGGISSNDGISSSSDIPSSTVYRTNFNLIQLPDDSAEFLVLDGWNVFPGNEDNRFILTRDNALSEPFNLRLKPREGLDSEGLTGVVTPFFGPLTSQGYSLSMDLHFSQLESENQFHLILDEPSRDNLTAWVWFDDGRIVIRNQITPEGRDFFDAGVSYEAGTYFNFEIRTDPLNNRILYFLDGEEIFEGEGALFQGSAPERAILAHLNHQTGETFDIDNFRVYSLTNRDFPRFQHRKQSGGIAAGESRQITFEVIADRPRSGVYEFDLVVNTNDAGNPQFTIPVRYEINDSPTSSEFESIAEEFRLHQNYPNPFNPSTTISYHIPEQSDVRLDVMTINGQRVITLVDERQHAGEHLVTFNAGGLASGVYLYRLQAGSFTKTQRMVLVK